MATKVTHLLFSAHCERGKSELHVRLQAADGFWREVAMQLQVVKTLQGTMQTAIFDDGLGLVERDVRMALQLVERQAVEVYLPRLRMVNGEVRDGPNREVLNLAQLLWTDVATQALTVLDDATGKGLADTGHLTQQQGIGGVQVDALRHFNLDGILQRVTPRVLLLADEGSGGCRQVGRYADVGFQLAILLYGKTIEAGEVLLPAKDSPSAPVPVDVTDLPGAQAQPEQLDRVGGIGVEGEALRLKG